MVGCLGLKVGEAKADEKLGAPCQAFWLWVQRSIIWVRYLWGSQQNLYLLFLPHGHGVIRCPETPHFWDDQGSKGLSGSVLVPRVAKGTGWRWRFCIQQSCRWYPQLDSQLVLPILDFRLVLSAPTDSCGVVWGQLNQVQLASRCCCCHHLFSLSVFTSSVLKKICLLYSFRGTLDRAELDHVVSRPS